MQLNNSNIREWMPSDPDANAGLRVEIVTNLLDEFEARGEALREIRERTDILGGDSRDILVSIVSKTYDLADAVLGESDHE